MNPGQAEEHYPIAASWNSGELVGLGRLMVFEQSHVIRPGHLLRGQGRIAWVHRRRAPEVGRRNHEKQERFVSRSRQAE